MGKRKPNVNPHVTSLHLAKIREQLKTVKNPAANSRARRSHLPRNMLENNPQETNNYNKNTSQALSSQLFCKTAQGFFFSFS
jgi:hypothetical protein